MKMDTITKDYISDARIFADVFNYYIYGGENVILPEQLTERDPVKMAFPYGADGAMLPVQKTRDAQMLYAAMTDGNAEYVLYGVENQAEIHYAMPVKDNLYDALDYAEQVEEAAKAHRRAMAQGQEGKRPNSGEFLSGFWKEDRLIPSVTVTIYFGCDPWDGPLSLFDMMDVADPKVLACMDNYHVRLIAPALMADEEIVKFQSSLREVLFFIKYSKDKAELGRILKQHEKRFREVERRAADVIEAITNTGLHYDGKEEKVDMCQAILEMREESKQLGKEEGRKEGELLKAKESAKTFYGMGLQMEQIAQGLGYTAETVRQWLDIPV